ncbi:hypothetical protein CONLIGDRAFT_686853 [Coniochaeta ligniaria NRRL 30616]|uniref:MYND-type domain-containing protein n=1 Tax=Coniochaeta ligniaria NRRL 30616 TaxID=1408157 RepID=A0A1J7IZN8_9PEZI|nr:hypothetical protein CONLIGDRAFT_686853 [Coniochaeta ligniaria NRRL 30616]
METTDSTVPGTSLDNVDPVEAFFQHLLSPSDHHRMTGVEAAYHIHLASRVFLNRADRSTSQDPDFWFLKKIITENLNQPDSATTIWNELVALAIDKKHGHLKDFTSKDRQLHYLHWIASGRQDATSPFTMRHGSNQQGHLLSSTCTVCKAPNATEKCSACLVNPGSEVTFATVYCGRDCQKKDWTRHKVTCMEVRALNRAVEMAKAMFHHALGELYPLEWNLQSIKQIDGIVVARVGNKIQKKVQHEVQFPYDLAESTDIAHAVLTHSQCDAPLTDAISLVEMLIRPACKSIKKVVFVPKNVHRPVRMIFADVNEFSSLHLHEVIRATLPCGLEFAIDLTSAQMGWKEILTPWASYSGSRVHQVRDHSLVPPRILCKPYFEANLRGELPALRPRAAVIEAVVHGLANQLGILYLEENVRKVLYLKAPDFAVARTTLVEAGKRGLSYVAQLAREDSARPVFAVDPGLLQTLSVQSDESAFRVACCEVELFFFTRGELMRAKRDMAKTIELVRPRWQRELKLGGIKGLDVKWRSGTM